MIDISSLPSTWIAKTLGEVAQVVMGQAPPGSSYNNDKIGVPLVAGAGDLGQIYPQPSKWTNAPTQLCERGDLIYCIRATIGDMNWADRQYCLGRGVAAIRSDQRYVLPDFLYYWLYTLKDYVTNLGTGSTFLQVRRQDIQGLQIPLPTLPEQHRIVEILHQADELRRLREDASKIAKSLAKSVFEYSFYSNRQAWQSYKIKDVVTELQAGKSFAANSHPAREGHWGILKVSAVTYGVYRPEENKELPEDVEPNTNYEVKAGDLLISRANTTELVGASVYVRNTPSQLLLPDKLWRLRLHPTRANPQFMYGLFNTKEVRREISLRATGTSSSMKNISQDKFLDIEIQLPSLETQQGYAEIISTVWNDVQDKQSIFVNLLEDMLRGLTFQAFTGELTLKWRSLHSDDLNEFSVQRDIVLGVRDEEPTMGDYRTGRVTQAEREEIKRMLSESLKPLIAQMAQSFDPIGKSMASVQEGWVRQLSEIIKPIKLPMPEIKPIFSSAISSALLGHQDHLVPIENMLRGINKTLAESQQQVVRQLSGMLENTVSWQLRDILRFDVIGRLSPEQLSIYSACKEQEAPFTIEMLQEETKLSADAVRRGLALLASLGLILEVSVSAQSSIGTVYIPAYRRITNDDEVKIRDLGLMEVTGEQ